MSTGFTSSIMQVWSKEFLRQINANAVMQQLVWTRFQDDFAQGGNTVNVRLPGTVTINSYTREGTISYQSLTWNDYTFSLNQQKYFAFLIDDLDAAQLDVSVIEPELEQAGIQMRNTIDTNLLGNYSSANASTTLGSTSLPFAVNKDNVFFYFNRMFTLLLKQNTATNFRWAAVIPPDIREMIANSPQMAARGTEMVDRNIMDGLSIKNFAGFDLYVSTNMAQVSSTWPLMFFHPWFIAYACQVKKIEVIERLPNNFASAARGLFLYDSNVFSQYNTFGGVLYATTAS